MHKEAAQWWCLVLGACGQEPFSVSLLPIYLIVVDRFFTALWHLDVVLSKAKLGLGGVLVDRVPWAGLDYVHY